MHSFKDSLNREWSIVRITVDSIDEVRQKTNLDLADPEIYPTTDKLRNDPVALIHACFVVVTPSPDSLKIDRKQFAAGFWGEAITDARGALWGALVDFFPKDRRAVLLQAIRWYQQREQKIEIDAAKPIEALLQESPALSELTPDLTPQENSLAL